ncbi:MAG: FtsW/RodA/SpoVE family cell cycle protein [Minisyncoccia bacterium]
MGILRKDHLLFLSLLFLIFLGLMILASISSNETIRFYSLKRQILFLVISLVFFFILSNLDWRGWINSSFILAFYFLSIFLLILVLIIGSNIKGARGWFQIGNFSFQPLELAKLSLVLVLAKFLSSHHKRLWQYPLLLKTTFFSFLPIFFVMIQPDLGGAMVLFLIWFFLVLISGIKLKQVLLIFLIIFLGLIFCWFFILKPYQKARIISFLYPEADPLGSGYNRLQALIAIGSGRIFGKGLGWGSQTQFRYLPLAKTDFIFSALAEEMGLIGISLFLVLFLVFLSRLVYWANNFSNNFCAFFTISFALKILAETTINILMNLGLIPIVGIGLPFLSLGGSQLLINFIFLGIISSMINNPG